MPFHGTPRTSMSMLAHHTRVLTGRGCQKSENAVTPILLMKATVSFVGIRTRECTGDRESPNAFKFVLSHSNSRPQPLMFAFSESPSLPFEPWGNRRLPKMNMLGEEEKAKARRKSCLEQQAMAISISRLLCRTGLGPCAHRKWWLSGMVESVRSSTFPSSLNEYPRVPIANCPEKIALTPKSFVR